jgi:hypothetical protein
VSEQLQLFVEGESNGPMGVLAALVELGLREDAYESAAALCLLLDEEANGHS